MTEADWLACRDSLQMLRYSGGIIAKRKSRLFACACCRRIWHHLRDGRSRRAVEVAEAFADGRGQLRSAREGAQEAVLESGSAPDAWANYAAISAREAVGPDPRKAAYEAAYFAQTTAAKVPEASPGAWDRELAAQADLLREMVGNVFHPVTMGALWLTPVVHSLASSIYLETSFDRLPILADALEDGGCADTTLLGHLRGGGPHVLGCWALDAILAKAQPY